MSVTLNAGSGGATCGTDTVAGTPNIDYQIVKLGYSVSGTTPTQVSASNPLPANVAQLGGNAIKTGSGNGSTGSLSVYLATDQPTLTNAQPVAQSGSWTVTANLGTLNGVALDASVTGLQVAQGSTTAGQKGGLTLGAVTTAAPTYTTAQSSPLSLTTAGALRVDGSAITQPVSGTFWQATQPISAASLPLPSGAATAAKQPALGTAGTASTDVITVQGIASMTALKVDGSAVTQPVSGTVTANAGTGTFNIQANASVNLNQVGGAAITLGSKTSANSLPVVIASDQGAVPALQSGSWSVGQSGTWTMQPGNTANTTPWLVTDTPATSGGLSTSALVSAASNNLTQLKSSQGQLYLVSAQNVNASPRYLKVFFKPSASVTMGTTAADCQFLIPGNTSGAGLVVDIAKGIGGSGTGLSIAITGGISLTDNTAIGANDCCVSLGYR